MKSTLFHDTVDIDTMRQLLSYATTLSTVVDFEEAIQLTSTRETMRLWHADEQLVAFAFVDPYDNLRFAISAAALSPALENEIVDWGSQWLQQRNASTGDAGTLDASCEKDDDVVVTMLERAGFVQSSVRSLRYARSLDTPIAPHVLSADFTIRAVAGEHEVEQLVALHRAAFGTDLMTVEERLAIIRAPMYSPSLDLVAVTQNGELVAFCIGSIEDEPGVGKVGYSDPIGTHPAYQQRGLGKAIVMATLARLKEHGITTVMLGTSSQNKPMQRLAESTGFRRVSEKLWFSKRV